MEDGDRNGDENGSRGNLMESENGLVIEQNNGIRDGQQVARVRYHD